MSDEFLSICIPTRNRSHLLRDLLRSIAEQIDAGGLTPTDVRVYVFDNASTDATAQVMAEAAGGRSHFTYSCNLRNIGAMYNVLLCCRSGNGRYRWLIGDDEWLAPGALSALLSHLREQNPGWFVHWDGSRYFTPLGLPHTYPDVAAFVQHASRVDPESLMAAGAISLNTFRSDCFDHAYADSLKDTSTYAHWYGLMNGLKKCGASVHFTGQRTVVVREQRPAPSDNELPADSDANWRGCLTWLRNEFHLPDLNPDVFSRLVSEEWMRQLRRHPWRTFRNNIAVLRIPSAWPRIFRRLWYLVKR